MEKLNKNDFKELKDFWLLWSTQSLSQLGSSITGFSLSLAVFDKKKTMLACDLFAALCTTLVFVLFQTNLLAVWHLYALNVLSGLMNTVQQPASEVAMTLIVPEKHYQKTSASSPGDCGRSYKLCDRIYHAFMPH